MWDSGDFIEKFTADPANGFSDIFNSKGGENQAPSSHNLLFFSRPLPLLPAFTNTLRGSSKY